MKKGIILIFSVIFLTPLLVFADNSLLGGNAAIQSFHQASDPAQKSPSTQTTSDNSAAEMLKVREIMQQAKLLQEKKAKTESSSLNANAPASTVSNVNSASKPNVQNTIQSPKNSAAPNSNSIFLTNNPNHSTLSDLSQSNTVFQEQTNQKISDLMNQNAELNQRIEKLKEALILLNQEVTQMNTALQTAKNQLAQTPVDKTSDWKNISNFLMQSTNYLIYGLILFLVALIIYHLFSRKTTSQKKNEQENQVKPASDIKNLEGDYDYMNSEEAIPSKLDLARSYLAMEDFSSAKKVLQEILLLGTPEQRTSAETMLQEIASKS